MKGNVMSAPLCPRGHGPMMLMVITQGEGVEEITLGKFWGCVNNDTGSKDYCDECEDYIEEPEQLNMFEGARGDGR